MNYLDRNEFNYAPSQEVVEALKNFDINKLCFYTIHPVSFSFGKQDSFGPSFQQLEIVALSSPALLAYLQGRGINIKLAKRECSDQFPDDGIVLSGKIKCQINGAAQRIFIVVLKNRNFSVCLINSFCNCFPIQIPQCFQEFSGRLYRLYDFFPVHGADGIYILPLKM